MANGHTNSNQDLEHNQRILANEQNLFAYHLARIQNRHVENLNSQSANQHHTQDIFPLNVRPNNNQSPITPNQAQAFVYRESIRIAQIMQLIKTPRPPIEPGLNADTYQTSSTIIGIEQQSSSNIGNQFAQSFGQNATFSDYEV